MTAKVTNFSSGTIINIAVNIFRSDLKNYFFLAAGTALWSILPIYGWAKSAQLSTVISIKAYQKLLGIEESTKDISRRLNQKLWSFWRLNVLGGLYVALANILCFLIVALITYLLFAIPNAIRTNGATTPPEIQIFIFFIVTLLYMFVFLGVTSLFFWLYGRVAFAELPLALEPSCRVFSSIARSWNLSKGQGRKIQMVFTIGSAVLSILWIGIPSLVVTTLTAVFGGFWLVYIGIWSLFVGLLQIVKAVIYYDLVCLQEGIDLKITS